MKLDIFSTENKEKEKLRRFVLQIFKWTSKHLLIFATIYWKLKGLQY